MWIIMTSTGKGEEYLGLRGWTRDLKSAVPFSEDVAQNLLRMLPLAAALRIDARKPPQAAGAQIPQPFLETKVMSAAA